MHIAIRRCMLLCMILFYNMYYMRIISYSFLRHIQSDLFVIVNRATIGSICYRIVIHDFLDD